MMHEMSTVLQISRHEPPFSDTIQNGDRTLAKILKRAFYTSVLGGIHGPKLTGYMRC